MDTRPGRSVDRLSRRAVLRAGAGSVVVAGLGGLGGLGLTSCSGSDRRGAPSTTSPLAGSPFAQPQELASRDGHLEVTLRVAAGTVPYGDGQRFAYTCNGTSPGPTLRVRPGDRLTLTLVNALTEPTNLHTHGLHVSPSGDADDIFVRVDPGTSRTYVYDIPTTQRSSLCWYHPHHHGLVAPQLAAGFFGAIVVEDDLDRIPELVGSTERLLLLHDPPIGSDASVLSVSGMESMLGREGDTVLVNGLAAPAIDADAGTLEHWRILNASPSRYYRLALADHPLQVVGTDGGRLERPVAVDDLLLAPGERGEVLVVPGTAGSHLLRSTGYDRGSPGMGAVASRSRDAVTLASLEVTGSAEPPALPATLAPPAALAIDPATGRQTFELAMGMGMGGAGGGMGGGGGMGPGRSGGTGSFTINGRAFDPSRTDVTARLQSVEEWVLTNTSTMDHPFHLHVWPFQVVERSAGPADLPGWKDTVNVPAGGRVRIRVGFHDITGRTVFHCHILDHEDLGMMGVIEVA